MTIGSVNQKLYIKSLPVGMKAMVTNVDLVYPSNKSEWWPTFTCGMKSLSAYTTEEKKAAMFPFEVSPDLNYGVLGEVGLTSLSVFDSGEGPAVKIDIELQALETPGGTTYKKVANAHIHVSTGEWGSWTSFWKFELYARPDETMVSYSLVDINGNLVANTTANKNTTLQSPNDINVAIGFEEGSNTKLGLKCEVNSDGWKTAINYALGGIFFVHKEAVGWVFGNVGLTAANALVVAKELVAGK